MPPAVSRDNIFQRYGFDQYSWNDFQPEQQSLISCSGHFSHFAIARNRAVTFVAALFPYKEQGSCSHPARVLTVTNPAY